MGKIKATKLYSFWKKVQWLFVEARCDIACFGLI